MTTVGRQGFVLCADDYGLSHGVCDGIEALIASGRLSATGAMTIFPEWTERANGLRHLADAHEAEIGLHLTLTDQALLTRPFGDARPDIAAMLRRALMGGFEGQPLEKEIAAQLDRFEDAFAAAPAFIDGHQHVHLLPGVRTALIDQLRLRYPLDRMPWIRRCGDPVAAILQRPEARGKGVVLAWFDRGLGILLRRYGLRGNAGFRGLYDFTKHRDYAAIFPGFLKPACAGMLVHCHPGIPDATLTNRDGLVTARASELAYFQSDAFIAALDAAGLEPRRLQDCGL